MDTEHIEDGDPAAPWNTNPLYGGMSPGAARRSWEAGQRRVVPIPLDACPPPVESFAEFELPPSPEEQDHEQPRQRFIPVAIDDVELSAEPAWLIDRLLPARGLAAIVGPPKCGKSFLASDLLFHVARGEPYAGRSTLAGPVVYLTGEGVQGFRRRLVAMRRHYNVEGQGVPFYMVESVPDLGSERTNLADLLRDLDQHISVAQIGQPRALVLDTLARCMGEGDESSARDMGRFVARCGLVERHYSCLVVVVHHVGKDPTRGARGSNALNGAADVTMIVEKAEGSSSIRVDEMKDGPEGQEWRFRLVPHDLSETFSTSETSTETNSCVVELLSEPTTTKQAETKSGKAPRGVNGDLLKVIRRAVQEAGEINVESVQAPNNVRAVSRANLRNYCVTMDWQDAQGKPDAYRAALSRGLSDLRSRSMIGFDRDWVWLT